MLQPRTELPVAALIAISLVVVSAIVVAGTVRAADFVISNGTTVTTTQSLTSNETGLVEPGGAIATTGFVAHGIVASGNNNTIINNGLISTTGNIAFGIFTNGTGNTINNGGVLTTSGLSGFGIVSIANSTINNSGVVSTSGANSHGILVLNNNAVVNSGTISTTGAGASGIIAFGINTTVTNSGLISATGPGALAISFGGGANSLTLLPGSRIVGSVQFGTGFDTLNVGNGLNLAMTFSTTPPEAINSNGAPFVLNGSTVAVVDPTALALADEVLVDLTNTISGAVLGRLNAARTGTPPGQVLADSSALTFANSIGSDGSGLVGWGQVFGLSRDQSASSPTVGADHNLGGLVTGLDSRLAPGTRGGFFLGGSIGELDVNFGSQTEDIDSVFGGLYGGYEVGSWTADLVITGGWSNYDRSRTVANNLAPNGVQTATADYDGYFIAPEAALSVATDINGQQVVPSVRLGYAGLHLDGFSETGAADGFSVSDRYVHLVTGRIQVAVPVRIAPVADTVHFEPYFGVMGRVRLDDNDVDAILLGQSISFDPGGDDNVGTALAGAELSAVIADNIVLFGRVEAGIDTDSGRTIAGQAGLNISF